MTVQSDGRHPDGGRLPAGSRPDARAMSETGSWAEVAVMGRASMGRSPTSPRLASFHRDPVRPCGAGREGGVEIQVEPVVATETVPADLDDVDPVIPLELDLP